MDRFLYVMLDSSGRCWAVTDGGTEKIAGLPWLLRQGWKPIRETPLIVSAGSSYVLILLERETETS
jgi:hypothetical protein